MTKIIEIKKCNHCPFSSISLGICGQNGKDIDIDTWVIPPWCPLPDKKESDK